jgi:hypothetical protein
LDISKNSLLQELWCGDNPLGSLNLSNNKLLTKLGCMDNQLSDLDLSNNSLLQELWCADNSLGSLNLSNNKLLTKLGCMDNQLSDLDLSKNNLLIDLCLTRNQFTFTELSKIKKHFPSLEKSDQKVFSTIEESVGFEVDYSQEVQFENKETTFAWKNQRNKIIDNSYISKVNTGVFKFEKPGIYHCLMTNEAFPETNIITKTIHIKNSQFITFHDLKEKVEANDVLQLNATASSGLPVSYEIISGDATLVGNTITFNQQGTVQIKAIQEGNDEYAETEEIVEIQVEVATGLDEIAKNTIRIYPNPVERDLTIELEGNEKCMIRIYDMRGKLVLQKESNSKQEQFNLSGFSAGMYLLKLQFGEKTITRKILKK